MHEYLDSFPKMESHYCRQSIPKIYIEDTSNFSKLTMKKMHDLYLEKCKTDGITDQKLIGGYSKYAEQFKAMNYANKKNQSSIRYVVDRYEDLLLVKKIFSKISKRPILMQDILQLFDQEKSLFEINKNIDRNEGYKKSLKEDAKAHDVCEK